jgi:hypothetical protein
MSQLFKAVKDIEYGISKGSLVLNKDFASFRTLEGELLMVKYTPNGFQVNTEIYESLDSLLMKYSPMFLSEFHSRVCKSLNKNLLIYFFKWDRYESFFIYYNRCIFAIFLINQINFLNQVPVESEI